MGTCPALTQGSWAFLKLHSLPDGDTGCCSYRKGSAEEKQSQKPTLSLLLVQEHTLHTGTASLKAGGAQSWQS